LLNHDKIKFSKQWSPEVQCTRPPISLP
jgi:hypothetical protein